MTTEYNPNQVQPEGLYEKFTVTRNDGRDRPGGDREGARYFVLDIENDKYAAAALRAYARHCERELPMLAQDILKLVEGK